MKGILLAGGSGTRLWPVTKAVNKHLLPIYNKPLVYYPLATMMMANIRDILVITTPADQASFIRLLGGGEQWGVSLRFATQERPDGLAQSFLIGAEFIGNKPVSLALGDNVFHGAGLVSQLASCVSPDGAHIFAYEVSDSSQYGVVELDSEGHPVSLEEKPTSPSSNLAVPGLYFYSSDVVDVAREVRPSVRGELEISSVNQAYLAERRLQVTRLSRGTTWIDAGTHRSLLQASEYVRLVEERQGLGVGVPEEVAWRNGWISSEDLLTLASATPGSAYSDYLVRLVGLTSGAC